ncbi:MAG: hypothetical protein AAGD04_01165 [Pseudomonadota bacterium]
MLSYAVMFGEFILAWFWFLPVFSLLVLVFAKQRWARLVVLLSLLFVGVAYTSVFWTDAHFKAVGCTGGSLKGVHCDEWSFVTKLAAWHGLSFILAGLYVIFVTPYVAIIIFVSEVWVRFEAWLDRKRAHHDNQTG